VEIEATMTPPILQIAAAYSGTPEDEVCHWLFFLTSQKTPEEDLDSPSDIFIVVRMCVSVNNVAEKYATVVRDDNSGH
jgi:hypothetical protein